MTPDQILEHDLFQVVLQAILKRSGAKKKEIASWLGLRQMRSNTMGAFTLIQTLTILSNLNIRFSNFVQRVDNFKTYIAQHENYGICQSDYNGTGRVVNMQTVEALYDKYCAYVLAQL